MSCLLNPVQQETITEKYLKLVYDKKSKGDCYIHLFIFQYLRYFTP